MMHLKILKNKYRLILTDLHLENTLYNIHKTYFKSIKFQKTEKSTRNLIFLIKPLSIKLYYYYYKLYYIK